MRVAAMIVIGLGWVTLSPGVVGCASSPAPPASTAASPIPAPQTPAPNPAPASVATTPPTVAPDSRAARLYECWFKAPYRYMFSGENRAAGTFMAGTNGIVYYGGLASCMGELANQQKSRVVGDHSPIEAFSRLPVLVSDGDEQFRAYNRELIRWGHEHLIPAPHSMIGDRTATECYHAQFERFFRLMTEAYLSLRELGIFDADADAYYEAVSSGTDGLDWLTARYAGWLTSYAAMNDGTTLTPAMAIGFWLRRGIDNTDAELWTGLRKVLLLYDAAWYGEMKQRYANAFVDW